MTKKDYEIAREVRNRISGVTEILDFRVFGSRARGDAQDDSDMDVFVEVPRLDRGLKQKIREKAWEVGLDNCIVISTLILSKDQVENSPLRASPIVENIFHEGVMI